MEILFFTGAGISAPSGIPVYRGLGGVWTNNPQKEKETNAATFARNPTLVWETIHETRRICNAALPNAAHDAITQLATHHNVYVVTQNVDSLHYVSQSNFDIYYPTIALHGDINILCCTECLVPQYFPPDTEFTTMSCECGGALRPGVVLFGDLVDDVKYTVAMAMVERCDMVIAVGTTGSVFPAANILIAANDRAYKEKMPFHYFNLEKNHEEYPFAQYHYGDASITLPEFLETL